MNNKCGLFLCIFFSVAVSCGSAKSFSSAPSVTRAYLHDGDQVSQDFGGYSYLLLQAPNPEPKEYAKDIKRLEIICQSFHNELEDYTNHLRRGEVKRSLMVIFYLLRKGITPNDS